MDARTAAFVDTNQRHAGFQREVLDLDDLLAIYLPQGAAEDGDVLAEYAHRAPVDFSGSRDDAVAEWTLGIHAERRRAVPGKLVELLEGALIQQRQYALACGLLPLGVLFRDGLG